ncbi:MAG: methyltransferase domain-containing protein [Chloroflexi bacterium]|nr:methyltransferase domain-containing protein [Chloroflexota bacterium]
MDNINSSDYHDYVIKNGKFIGQFDQMYRNVADPWHQDEDGLSDKEPLRVLALQEMVKIKPGSILDIGCGLGFFTNQMQLVTEASVLGIDISSTAVSKAVARYPNCRFETRGIAQICGFGSKFDLIVAS